MKTTLAAIALAATLGQPASAITFPSLATIYIGAGVRDNGGATNTGIATIFHCTNVSGLNATIRFLVLGDNGAVQGNASQIIGHGGTVTASTKGTNSYFDDLILATGEVGQGVVNIESTQSGVFCTAETLDAAAAVPTGVARQLVRINPHPGTVE